MKLYSEKEIGAILKRAAELSMSEAGSNAGGLSLEELQQIGREAGIDPDLILKAASELQNYAPPRERNVIGGPIRYANDFVLEGEIDGATWEEMIAAIRNSFKDPGVVSTRENVFEWTSQGETEKAQVTALISSGRTKISLFWAEPVLAVPLFIPTLVGTIISLPITFESLGWTGLPAAALIVSVFMTLFSLSRFAVSRMTDNQVARIRQLEAGLSMIASKRAHRILLEGRSSDPVQISSSL
jgi:hypothetical protein